MTRSRQQSVSQRKRRTAAAWHLGDDFSIAVTAGEESSLALRFAHASLKPKAFADRVVLAGHRARQLLLGLDARRVACEPNAGGNSVVSESLSMEYFARRFGASDVVCEMEIRYWSLNWKKVDFLCVVRGQRVGVSVTRAMGFPSAACFTADSARHLLRKKLHGLVVARAGIVEELRYTASFLHVWCQDKRIAGLVRHAFGSVARELCVSGDVTVLITVADQIPAVFTDDLRCLGMGLARVRM